MSKTASRVLWAAALCVLAAALFFFNRPVTEPALASEGAAAVPAASAETAESPAEASAEASEPEKDIPRGNAVGQRLPDFTLTDLEGNPFVLGDCRGRAVFINLWATWCDPCVKELPYFDRLQREHPEDVTVLAVHSGLIIEDDIPGFAAALNCDLTFAVDETGDFTSLVGGTSALPHTVVLDRDGVVIYNLPGSVTYETLEELAALATGE